MVIRTSAAYVAGMQRGFRLCGRSLWRRLVAALVVWVFCLGTGLGFLWAAADVFLANTSGETVVKRVVGKFTAWNLVHPKGTK